MMLTEISTEISTQSRLESILVKKNLRHDLDFFRLRFRQMGMDPESMDEQHLGLHIDTINTMFTAHCELPYDD